MMNRTSLRLTRTCFALAVLSLAVTGCTEAGNTTPTLGAPTLDSPNPSNRSQEGPPAASPAAPTAPEAAAAPKAVNAPRAVTTPRAGSAPNAVTEPTALTGRTKTGTPANRAMSTRCRAEQTWGTRSVFGSYAMSQAPLYLTRVGRHDCFDRVVFDINGPQAVGLVARYVPVVAADGSGKPVPVSGRAALEVIVRAPILGADNQGQQPWRPVPAVGESLVTPAAISGWPSLRAVRFAGSFEGQTTVAVGVRERLPFRAFVTRDGAYQRVVVDIAH